MMFFFRVSSIGEEEDLIIENDFILSDDETNSLY